MTSEPIFAHDEPGYRESIARVAVRLAETGESVDAIASQVRNFVQRHLVHVRAIKGSGRTAHNLFAPADVAVAKVLRILTGLGLANAKLLQDVSIALYAWDANRWPAEARKLGLHPITTALVDFAQNGAGWVLRIDILTNDQTGEKVTEVAFYNPESSHRPASRADNPTNGFMPEASIVVPIYRWLPRILGNATAAN